MVCHTCTCYLFFLPNRKKNNCWTKVAPFLQTRMVKVLCPDFDRSDLSIGATRILILEQIFYSLWSTKVIFSLIKHISFFTKDKKYQEFHCNSFLKSVNLQYITLGCLDLGTLWCSKYYFLICTFYRLRALKTLYFYFCNIIKR